MKTELVICIVAIDGVMLSYSSVRAGTELQDHVGCVVLEGNRPTTGEAIYTRSSEVTWPMPRDADTGAGHRRVCGDWDGLHDPSTVLSDSGSRCPDAPQSLGREENRRASSRLLSKTYFPSGEADLSERGRDVGVIKYVARNRSNPGCDLRI